MELALLILLTIPHAYGQLYPQVVAGRAYTDPIADPLRVATGFIRGVAPDSDGNVYISTDHNVIYRRTPDGRVSHFAGTGAADWSGDGGPAAKASFLQIGALATDRQGNLYLVDGNRVRLIEKISGMIRTIAGTGQASFTGDGVPALEAAMNQPSGLDVDAQGNVYIAGYQNNRILKFERGSGLLRVVAGNGVHDFTEVDDIPALQTVTRVPYDVKLDRQGTVYWIDNAGSRIRYVGADGMVRSAVGAGNDVLREGGVAKTTAINGARWLDFDLAGNLAFNVGGQGVWRVRNGLLERVSGPQTTIANCTDGIPAIASCAYGWAANYDDLGNLFIGEVNLRRIRATDQVIETVFGNGKQFFCGEGESVTAACLSKYGPLQWSGGRLYASNFRDGLVEAEPGGKLRHIDQTSGVLPYQISSRYAYQPQFGQFRRISLETGNEETFALPGSAFSLAVSEDDSVYYLEYLNGGSLALSRWVAGQNTIVRVLTGPTAISRLLWTGGALYAISSFGLSRVDTSTGAMTAVPGPFTWVQLIAGDGKGNLYWVEPGLATEQIRKRSPEGVTTTRYEASNALSDIAGLAVSTEGLVYFLERGQIKVLAPDCTYTLSRTSYSLAAAGDFGRLQIETAPGCGWSAESDSTWVTTSARFGVGSGEIRFLAAANPTGYLRRTTLRVAGVPIPIDQAPADCVYTVSPTSMTFPGSNGQLRIETRIGCPWRVSTLPAWLEATQRDGTFGTTITIQTRSEPTEPRAGVISVAGIEVPVVQRPPNPTQYFADVPVSPIFGGAPPPSPFEDYIAMIRGIAIRENCAASNFCPGAPMNRGEVAALIVRRLMGGDNFVAPQFQYFDDVPPAHPYFRHIQKLRELGVTAGCDAQRFCPGDLVNRGQIAALLVRVMQGVPLNPLASFPFPAEQRFTDVAPGHLFFPHIQKFVQLNITQGCTATTYCAEAPITRAQMAVFLVRATSR